MLSLSKIYIPTLLDFNPKSKQIKFIRPDLCSSEYYDNIECVLNLRFMGSCVYVEYLCDDESVLSENLELTTPYISKGDLESGDFDEVQRDVFKILCQFMEDPETEALNEY